MGARFQKELELSTWLATADGIARFAADTGIQLSQAIPEGRSGRFRCDIKANSQYGKTAIEVQFRCGNHGHLGQLITYATCSKSSVAIWVAEDFKDAHLECLIDLNQRIVEPKLHFYAIRLHYKQTNPHFVVVVDPNVKSFSRMSETEYSTYWRLLFSKLKNWDRSHAIEPDSGDFARIRLSARGAHISLMRDRPTGQAGIRFVKTKPYQANALHEFARIRKAQLESALGILRWDDPRKLNRMPIDLLSGIDFFDEEASQAWFVSNIDRFYTTFNDLYNIFKDTQD